MSRHSGRFKWKKYSRYKGNLKIYWCDPLRPKDHRLTESTLYSPNGTFIDVFGDLHVGNRMRTLRSPRQHSKPPRRTRCGM